MAKEILSDIEVDGKIAVKGGAGTEFLKANGDRDSNTYEKRSKVRVLSEDPTNTEFVEWDGDILMATNARNLVLPAAGILSDNARFLVKTTATGTVQFSTDDDTVEIEYNDVNALGYMSERCEAWVMLVGTTYYITGEVA